MAGDHGGLSGGNNSQVPDGGESWLGDHDVEGVPGAPATWATVILGAQAICADLMQQGSAGGPAMCPSEEILGAEGRPAPPVISCTGDLGLR